jgi:Tfp pilus assembly protein PilF
MSVARMFAVAIVLAALAGCETAPVKEMRKELVNLLQPSGKAEEALAAGVRAYDDAKYVESSQLLQAGLDEGLSARSDRVRAHKYLAFIHCVSGRQAQCRNEFRMALVIDPSFELAPSEAGHPMWGPVFRSVKAQGR